MGAAEVAYHEATVLAREDDHPGRALAYYGSRGETPLRWGGRGAPALGLVGEVTPHDYELAFGPGGFRDPNTEQHLVATRRPGFELVVSAHKTVAVAGVAGGVEAMHSILDVETAATMGWLDDWFERSGGRRGRAQERTPTGGLTYAVTRHATSRAGDPSPHDHVLVANVVQMRDERGGFKALDSAALRDTVEAATMVGRLHSAARAVQLGFQIEPDDGPSGRLRHWRIVGVPADVCELFSKRADEIAEHLAATGETSYRARGIAARVTRSVKRHIGPDQLTARWEAELADAGWPLERLREHLRDQQISGREPERLDREQLRELVRDLVDVDGDLLRSHKVFTRTNLVAELAPRLYGQDPALLDEALDLVLAGPDVVPLIGVANARERAYTTVDVLAAERTIAKAVDELTERPGRSVSPMLVDGAIGVKEADLGSGLTSAQRQAVEALCTSTGALSVIVGVAGAGKTTALDAATDALEDAGWRVIGSSTSGQATRTLGQEAHISSRTLASLLWRLDHHRDHLDERTVVIVDEAGMASDADLARLLLAVGRAGAHLALVGDPQQLSPVGPGGALTEIVASHPEVVVSLTENARQRDPREREALAELRNGSAAVAARWYADHGRVAIAPTRAETLIQMVDAWSLDGPGKDTVMLAWRREDVADLNRLARQRRDQLGQLHGPDVEAPGGRHYAIGDVAVTLAPNHRAGLVTSQRLLIVDAEPGRLTAVTEDDRRIALQGDEIDTDHLDHAYALTVHRAQGATYDRAHVLASGGGRELAYVALSRARDGTWIHSTADSLADAVDDLQADWGIERNQVWITSPKSDVETELDRDVAALLDRLDNLGDGAAVGVELPDVI